MKKNKLNITNVYMGQNEAYPSLESNHGTRESQLNVLTNVPRRHWNYRKNIGGKCCLCVLNLVWTWNYCCKLEIVWADGSTFVVTMP
jgi:hypothetical protein